MERYKSIEEYSVVYNTTYTRIMRGFSLMGEFITGGSTVHTYYVCIIV